MNVLLNGETLSLEKAQNIQNRGFRFGDGCFETIIVHNGSSPLLTQHMARLKKSLQQLGLAWPEQLNIEEQLKQITEESAGWKKVRLWLWRAGEGVYAPETDLAHFMMAAYEAQAPAVQLKQQALFSKEVALIPSRWSYIKSISALPYIMAAREKKKQGADELILLNHRAEVAEASMANLFWKKRKRWYTPALDTGCVAGVMRSWIMKKLLEKGEPVFEVQAGAEELQKVDKLLCTNVTGLYPIAQLDEKQYDTDVEELWSLMPDEYRLS